MTLLQEGFSRLPSSYVLILPPLRSFVWNVSTMSSACSALFRLPIERDRKPEAKRIGRRAVRSCSFSPNAERKTSAPCSHPGRFHHTEGASWGPGDAECSRPSGIATRGRRSEAWTGVGQSRFGRVGQGRWRWFSKDGLKSRAATLTSLTGWTVVGWKKWVDKEEKLTLGCGSIPGAPNPVLPKIPLCGATWSGSK